MRCTYMYKIKHATQKQTRTHISQRVREKKEQRGGERDRKCEQKKNNNNYGKQQAKSTN